MELGKRVVAHSVTSWLSITMTWIFTQLKYLQGFSSIVLTESTRNLHLFPWDTIYLPRDIIQLASYRFFKKAGKPYCPPFYDPAFRLHQPRLLHSHFGNRGWYDIPIAKKHKLKHIVTFYGSDVNRLPTQQPVWRNRYKELFCEADLFLCEGPYMAESIVRLGCPPEKVKVQRLGVELDDIPFVPRSIENKDPVRILIAGTFREKKGIPYALKAIGHLNNKYPGLQVTIIGDSTGEPRDEEEKKRILEVIDRYQLSPRTRLLGFQTYDVLMAESYRHHIFLSPSVTASDGDTEGGAPVTIIEMIASGMPVISTKHCDIPQVIQHKRTGLLCEERDVEGLAELLSWLIECPDEWPAILSAARKHVENDFDARTQGVKLADIYSAVLHEM